MSWGRSLDLSDIENLEVHLEALLKKVTGNGEHKLDHIVHCAGDSLKLPQLHEITPENALRGFHVRWLAAALIGKLLGTGQYMHVAPSSSFTLTGGTNTVKPMPGWSVGASWGGASEGLMRGLAVDLKPIREGHYMHSSRTLQCATVGAMPGSRLTSWSSICNHMGCALRSLPSRYVILISAYAIT